MTLLFLRSYVAINFLLTSVLSREQGQFETILYFKNHSFNKTIKL
jgi:hypothetical protein